MKRSLELLISSGVLLASFTALLYCIGVSYQNAYLNVFDLNISILERSFNLTLYSGLIYLINFIHLCITLSIVAMAVILSCIVLLIALLFIDKVFPIKKVRQFTEFCKRPKVIKEKVIKEPEQLLNIDYYAEFFFKTAKYFLIFVFLFLILLLMIVFPSVEGEKDAQTILEQLKTPDAIPNNKLISVHTQDKPLKLYLLDCGSKFCAGVDPQTHTVYYFSQDQLTYSLFEEHPKK